jgi:hypothetical protein
VAGDAERLRERGDQERRWEDAAAPGREEAPTAVSARIGNAGMARLARDGAGLMEGGRVHPDVESMIARQRGGGSALDDASRNRLSDAYDDPLGDVRVHTGDTADQLARSVQARAFTVGSDVFFADGQYAPGSTAGDTLISHEVAHVVQQRGASTSGPLQVTDPGDAMEREADTLGEAAARHEPGSRAAGD